MISIGKTQRGSRTARRRTRRLANRRRLRGLAGTGADEIFKEITANEEKKLRELFSQPWTADQDQTRRDAIDAANTRVNSAYLAAIMRDDLDAWERAELAVTKNAWDKLAMYLAGAVDTRTVIVQGFWDRLKEFASDSAPWLIAGGVVFLALWRRN